MQLGNLKVGVRLGIGFGLIVLLMLIASTHSVQRISGLNDSIDLIITSRYPRIVAIAELQTNGSRWEVPRLRQPIYQRFSKAATGVL
jgi:CHASE3 domain sensor protein